MNALDWLAFWIVGRNTWLDRWADNHVKQWMEL